MGPLLVCPACREASPDGDRLDLRTLERTADVLRCECGATFPVIDGVPVLAPVETTGPHEPDLAPAATAAAAAPGPDDAPAARVAEHLSTYLDAHWGDRAGPPPDGPGGFACGQILELLAALPRVGTVVELGSSVGRTLAQLASHADLAIGVELSLAACRRARRLLAGEALPFARRAIGRHYTTAVIAGQAAANVTLVCADALDPPLVPQSADRVVALNLLDSVPDPLQLLLVCDGLLVPGGELVLASPFAWQSAVLPDDRRLGGADPAAALAELLSRGPVLGSRYEIRERADLEWALRRDARSAVVYRTHYLRAVKRGRGN